MTPMIKSISILVVAIAALIAPAQAREPLDEGVSFVDVAGGDPSNPAILDTKGDYTEKLLRDAEKTGTTEAQGKSWVWVKLKPKFHPKDRVCEAGRADIYQTASGNLIVKYARYFDARLEPSGKMSCSDEGRLDYSLSPTLDHYLTGVWAVEALKRPILRSYGTIKNPFCQPQFADPCPTREEVEALLNSTSRPSTKSCKPNLPGCIKVHVTFFKKRNGSVVAGQSVDFSVTYKQNRHGVRQLKDYSFDIPLVPVSGPPGAPRILGPSDSPK
ncbi:MAG: hypothetical protein J0H88_18415 [Sphingomonadales bacterium]|nr:hypothetical protein [Sphingomonadales bacterium]